MLTVGVDLAAVPARTAVCSIDWSTMRPLAKLHPAASTDAGIVDLARDATKVGIDCPFGWPDPFVAAVQAHAAAQPWPGREMPPEAFRRELSYRLTDEDVRRRLGQIPLSVSTDRIGVTAMRCAALLDLFSRNGMAVDRSGSGQVAEVYPAAALRIWGFDHRRYKRAGGTAARAALVANVLDSARWLSISDEDRQHCLRSDDFFDSLIAALIARAAALGRTRDPSDDDVDRARREGWIRLPDCRLEELCEP